MITVVSGLPRSGTSMMMRMLEAGGVQPVTDNLRQADEDNPKGYYEFEKVMALKDNASWVPEVEGKAVKMVSMLLFHLPPAFQYRVVFMKRDIEEILNSQEKMLQRLGKPGGNVPREKLTRLYTKHFSEIEQWLAAHPSFQVLYVSYNAVLANPAENVSRINDFFGNTLNEAAMREVVDASLYRQRNPAGDASDAQLAE